MRALYVNVDDDVDDALFKLCQETRISKREVVNDALRKYLMVVK